jgi:4-hydroxy-tetrahydrodipicolinate synthase
MVSYALDDNNIGTARNTHYKILDFVKPLFAEGNPAGIKTLLHIIGICQEEVRLPLVKSSENLRAIIQKKWEKLN